MIGENRAMYVRWTIRRVVSRALERGRASSRGRARATASTSFVVARTCNDGAWTSEVDAREWMGNRRLCRVRSSSARRGRRRRRRRSGARCGVPWTRGIGDGETLNDGRDGGKTRAWRRDGRRRGRGEGGRMKMNARVIRNVRARGLTDGVLVACAAFHRSGIRAQEA
jgi:hypothetical protein